MTTYTIKVPKTVTVHLKWADDKGKAHTKDENYPFTDFIDAILNLPEWSKGWKAIKHAIEVEDAVKKAKGSFELSDGPYDLLKKVLESPEAQGYGLTARTLRAAGSGGYFGAVIDAEEKKS